MFTSPSSTNPAVPGSTLLRAWPTTRQIRNYLPAVSMTLAAGAVMMVGGHLFHDDGWSVAGSVMTPAGPLISIALALAVRARNPGLRRSPKIRARLILSLLLPSPPGDLTVPRSLLVSAVTLTAGAVMALAGYATAAWNLLLVPPIILAGGAVISSAFLIASKGSRRATAAARPARRARTEVEDGQPVMRPMLAPVLLVNHSAPSGPAVIPNGADSDGSL